jgi:hypothetical protein
MVRDLEGAHLENRCKDIWERGVCIDLSKWTKDLEIFVNSHVNAHQKVTSAGEDFSNQVDRMTCSVGCNLFLQPSLHGPMGLRTKWSWWQGWMFLMGSAIGTSHQG